MESHKALLKALSSPCADFQISLFAAALLSYRRGTCLKPFPPSFTIDGTKNYDELTETFNKIPPLKIVSEKLNDPTYVKNNQDVVDLLQFILVDSSEPSLVAVPRSQIDSILNKAPSEIEVSKPQYVFELISSSRSQMESKWLDLAKDRNTFFAYHGSRLENFHSIYHHGLQQHMNKNNLYGSGTYLSSELGISLPYSSIGLHWDNSRLGQYLSCVALCELIDYPTGIISQRSDKTEHKNNTTTSRVKAKDSLGGEIPHKYYVVSNNDLIRVRYLLVYAKKDPELKNHIQSNVSIKGAVRRWISQYKLLAAMLAYFFILFIIGSSNNPTTYYYYKTLMKKIGLVH